MPHNLYSLTKDELKAIAVQNLFDRKDGYILIAIIDEEKPIKQIASELNICEQAVYERIAKIKVKLRITKWTDDLEK